MGDLPMAVLLVAGAATLALYWIAFFGGGGDVKVVDDESYDKFERAFPVADAWLAACMLVAAAGLVMEQPFGYAFMLLAGGAGIFLGLMDVTYAAQNGFFRLIRSSFAMRLNVVIYVLTLGLGTLFIAYAMPMLL